MLLVVTKRKKEKLVLSPGEMSLEHCTAVCTAQKHLSNENGIRCKNNNRSFWTLALRCNCKAHLQMGCSSVSHMYARTRIWAGLRQHQTVFDLAHPFSANKNAGEPTFPPVIFDFIVSKI